MKESYREGVANHPGPEPCEGNENLPPRAHPRRSLQHGPRTRSPIRLSTQTRLTVENPPQVIEVGGRPMLAAAAFRGTPPEVVDNNQLDARPTSELWGPFLQYSLRKIGVTGQDHFHRGNQLFGRIYFQDVATDTGFQRASDQLPGVVHAKQDRVVGGSLLLDPAARFDAGQMRHADVGNHGIWL